MTRSDAQGAVDAECLAWNREQEKIHQGELEAEIRKEKFCFQCSPDGEFTIEGVCEICKELNRKSDLQFERALKETDSDKGYITCGSCEMKSPEPTEDGECPNCRSGNWVWGEID
jgi:hypothetical protein